MKIKILVMDVDGTLTDGGIYIGNQGEIMKRFNVKDGYAIHDILPKEGILPVILTGRHSEIVNFRSAEIGIDYVIQSSGNKGKDLQEICERLGVSLREVAYIGDDLNDMEAMKLSGIRGCPADATEDIINICEFVSKKNGGHGAVRDFVEWIIMYSDNMNTSDISM